jgi:hypothetical protein
MTTRRQHAGEHHGRKLGHHVGKAVHHELLEYMSVALSTPVLRGS